jgi:hypothetical protein
LADSSSNDDQSDDEKDKDKDKDKDKSGDRGSVDHSFELIDTGPLDLDQTIDQPVTSGSDIGIGDDPGGDI